MSSHDQAGRGVSSHDQARRGVSSHDQAGKGYVHCTCFCCNKYFTLIAGILVVHTALIMWSQQPYLLKCLKNALPVTSHIPCPRDTPFHLLIENLYPVE